MAIDYDTDILTGLWTGAEDAEDPYAAFIAANTTLTDDPAENRILATIEVLRSHLELLQLRGESRLFHFCLTAMLEEVGSGGFIYGATSDNENAIVEGNVPNPVFTGTELMVFHALDGVSTGALIASVATGGATATIAAATINGTGALTAAGITASVVDGRLRITQAPVGGATAAAGFVILAGDFPNTAGIRLTDNPTQSGLAGGFFLAKVIEVANAARDRALEVFEGQRRDADFS